MSAPRGVALSDLKARPPANPRQPLMARHVEAGRYVEDGGRLRLIGLEVRLRDPFGMQEEVLMVPLEIELPKTCNASMAWRFGPCTVHTSAGDVNLPDVPLPASAL